MKNKINLEKIINNTDKNKSSTSVAFKTEDINFDLESIKEALKVSDKIFLQIGSFKYDEDSYDEPCFIIDEEYIIDELEYIDECYEEYKSDNAGYGIYLDKNLNVEYGYYTEELTIFGRPYRIFHDLKNARDNEVKIEQITRLANADIWITPDISMYDFHNKCDLEKLVKLINWGNVSIFGAFDWKTPVSLGNLDSDSFKEALNNYDEIFLELGDFSYSSEYGSILIETHDNRLNKYEEIYDIKSEYEYEIMGYGIYLDKDLNVEYGYYTNKYSPYTQEYNKTFHDFEDARDDDEVKNKIYSILDELDIWNQLEVSIFPEDKMYCPFCRKKHDNYKKFCTKCRTKLISGTLINEKIQTEQEIRNNHLSKLSESLDEASVMSLANTINPYSWIFDSKESLLINMLKLHSFNEISMMSKNIPKDEYQFFKSFNELDKESAREFYEYTTNHSFRTSSKEIILKHLLNSYPINELYEKLMSFNSLDN